MKKTKINNDVIRDFINEFYRIELRSKSRDSHIAKARAFYYYLCYKYSNDITSAKQVASSINKKQHGTVLSCLEKFDEMKVYDKTSFIKYQKLESAFLEEYEPFKHEDSFNIENKDILMLRARLIKLTKSNILLRDKLKNLKIKVGLKLLKKVS